MTGIDNIIKVMVAENTGLSGIELKNYLNKQPRLRVTGGARNAEEAVYLFNIEIPDVLVIDFFASCEKEVKLLTQLYNNPVYSNLKTIFLLDSHEEKKISEKLKRKANAILKKPIKMEELYHKIVETVDSNQSYTEPIDPLFRIDIDDRTTSALLEIGIPANIKGFSFLREAVEMVIFNPEVIDRVTKVLYPGVAEKFSSTPERVERAIRHAIGVAWAHKHMNNLHFLYGKNIYGNLNKPKNSEFIALLAEKIRIDEERKKVEDEIMDQ